MSSIRIPAALALFLASAAALAQDNNPIPTPLPEPGVLPLVGLAVAGALIVRRIARRNKKK